VSLLEVELDRLCVTVAVKLDDDEMEGELDSVVERDSDGDFDPVGLIDVLCEFSREALWEWETWIDAVSLCDVDTTTVEECVLEGVFDLSEGDNVNVTETVEERLIVGSVDPVLDWDLLFDVEAVLVGVLDKECVPDRLNEVE
jgi:hypothetical protein